MQILDPVDVRLLSALQRNAQASAADLSGTLNLSPSQISRRKARLEEAGYIRAYVAQLSPATLGLDVQAFIQVQMASQVPQDAAAFLTMIRARAEVISAWTLTGEADYLLRVYTPDLARLNHLIHAVILPNPSVARVQSQIVMDQPKPDAGLPV